MTTFNPICDSISIHFSCPHCGQEVTIDSMPVPMPDFSAEKNSDSMNYENYDVQCGNCGHVFIVTVYNSMYGGEVEIDGVDSFSIDEEYSEDDYSSFVFDLTPERITDVLDEIEALSVSTKEYLYKQLYVGAITSLEAFLSSTLIQEVLSSETNKRIFVKKYLPFREQQIRLSSIYEQIDNIDSTIKQVLQGLLYHDLGKIKPIYRDVLEVDLGDIREIMKAVAIRHDIVHRSGKSKEGIIRIIEREDVYSLVEKVSMLISKVQMELAKSSVVSLSISGDDADLPF